MHPDIPTLVATVVGTLPGGRNYDAIPVPQGQEVATAERDARLEAVEQLRRLPREKVLQVVVTRSPEEQAYFTEVLSPDSP